MWRCTGYVHCINALLDHGADGTARMDMGWTPAHLAAESGKLAALKALHASGISVTKKDLYGDRPRRIAEVYGRIDCARFLQQ
jgi:ankyrin repeat protein